MVDDREVAIKLLREKLSKSVIGKSGIFEIMLIPPAVTTGNSLNSAVDIDHIPQTITSQLEFAKYVYRKLIEECDPNIAIGDFPVIDNSSTIIFDLEYRKIDLTTKLELVFQISPTFNVYRVQIQSILLRTEFEMLQDGMRNAVGRNSKFFPDAIRTFVWDGIRLLASPSFLISDGIRNMNRSWEIRTQIDRIPKPTDPKPELRKFVNDAVTAITNVFLTKIFDKLKIGKSLTTSASSSKSSSGSQTPNSVYLG